MQQAYHTCHFRDPTSTVVRCLAAAGFRHQHARRRGVAYTGALHWHCTTTREGLPHHHTGGPTTPPHGRAYHTTSHTVPRQRVLPLRSASHHPPTAHFGFGATVIRRLPMRLDRCGARTLPVVPSKRMRVRTRMVTRVTPQAEAHTRNPLSPATRLSGHMRP